MPIHNRKATCDVCGKTEEEKIFGTGWPRWSIVNGVGAVEPDKDKPLENKNLETYLCPEHTQILARFMTDMQEANIELEGVG